MAPPAIVNAAIEATCPLAATMQLPGPLQRRELRFTPGTGTAVALAVLVHVAIGVALFWDAGHPKHEDPTARMGAAPARMAPMVEAPATRSVQGVVSAGPVGDATAPRSSSPSDRRSDRARAASGTQRGDAASR